MQACPIIETECLRLRPFEMDDFEAYAAFYASDRAKLTGQMDRKNSWYNFAAEAGLWSLRGYGYWSVEDRNTAKIAGHIGILNNVDYIEAELGWILYDGYEGKGLGYEGAYAARDWIYANTELDAVVSYIGKENTRSIALAERLGATEDKSVDYLGPDDLAYRHPKKSELS